MKKYNPKLFVGTVFHKRFSPKVHQFIYSTFFVKLSLFNLEAAKNILFSINGFNFFSFNFKDHGFRDGSSLIDFANFKLKENNVELKYDDIVIHTYPRILGFVFNPVSFWYFYLNGNIVGKLIEVNNTFGETTSYVIVDHPRSVKSMQVSPFNLIKGDYKFLFKNDTKQEKVEIQYFVENEQVLYASIQGKEVPYNWKSFLILFLKNPLINLAAVFFIHFEALRLYIKKVPFYGKNGVVYDK